MQLLIRELRGNRFRHVLKVRFVINAFVGFNKISNKLKKLNVKEERPIESGFYKVPSYYVRT
jgi:hypothetical protein